MITFHSYISHRTWLIVIEKALVRAKKYHFRMLRVNCKYLTACCRLSATMYKPHILSLLLAVTWWLTNEKHESYASVCCSWGPLEYLFAPCLTSAKLSPCRSLHSLKWLTADSIALSLLSLSSWVESCCALLCQYESLLWKHLQMAQKPPFWNFFTISLSLMCTSADSS